MKQQDAEARLAALETENFELRARLATVEASLPPTKKPAPRRDDDDRPLITEFLPVANPKHLPTEVEAAALLKIVTTRFPVLKFRDSSDELESFRASFAYVVSLTKTTQPVKKYAASWWIDAAQTWCRSAGVLGIVRSLAPAIVASCDVQFSPDDWSAIWLDPHRTSGRAVDPCAWKKLLNGGDLLAPLKLDNVIFDQSVGWVNVRSAW